MQKKWMVHALAYCTECDWESNVYFTKVVKAAKKHHEKTGHVVRGEVGSAFEYRGDA